MRTSTESGAWRLANGRIVALDRPRLMAILNITPNSFYDGGVLTDAGAALAAAERAVAEGADLLDIGGESTHPGAARVEAAEQIRRVAPVIEAIRRAPGAVAEIPISVDTTLAPVARAALDAGADAINDVASGQEDAAMLPLAAARGAGIVLMHRLAPPDRDRYSDRYERPPEYADVMASVREFLADRTAAALEAGCEPDRIVLDPGLGFGKTVEQNLELIRRTGELTRLPPRPGLPEGPWPVLSALSRKSFVGRAGGLEGSEPAERLAPTLGLSLMQWLAGACLFRVHDVAAHRQALAAAAQAMPPALDRWAVAE